MLYRIITLTDTPETYAEPISEAEDADGAQFIRNTVIYTDAAGERHTADRAEIVNNPVIIRQALGNVARIVNPYYEPYHRSAMRPGYTLQEYANYFPVVPRD